MPKDIFTELTAYLQRIERDVAALETARDFAMPAYNLSASPPQEPVEAQWAINKADGKPWYYYDGAWHECVCGEPETSGYIAFQADDASDFFTDLYVFDIAAGTISRIVETNREFFSTVGPPVWNADQTYVYYPYRSNENDQDWEFRRIKPDGTDMSILYDTDFNAGFSEAAVQMQQDGTMFGTWRNGFVSPHQHKLVNIETGTVYTFAANVVPGMTTLSGSFIHPSELRIVTQFDSSSTTPKYYHLDAVGTNVVGPIHDNTYDAGRPAGHRWNPADNGQMAYRHNHASGNSIRTLNEDGTGENLVIIPSPNSFLDYPQYSPDGSKIATQSVERLFIANSDGTGTQTVIDGGEPWWYAGWGFAWSPDGTQICVLIVEEDVKVAIDIVTIATQEITRVFEDTTLNPVNYIYAPSWQPGINQ